MSPNHCGGGAYELDDENVTAEVARTGRIAVIGSFDQRFDGRFNKGEMSDKVSCFIPIVHNGDSIAVLATGNEHSEREQMLHQIKVLRPFFDLAAMAL